ncbi:class I SAM-dependent methyltransferase [candidate division KSB1 bacterium]|nr:class I SAM-dependent methyltransferase [candidate division KSB1 bacterium]
MIELPDFNRSFEYENDFYLSCEAQRLGKAFAHYELYKKTMHIPGQIVECGVFKGASLSRFAMLRELYGNGAIQKIIAFDTFGKFPEIVFEDDREKRQKFTKEAGDESISCEQMKNVLMNKNCEENIELIEGDICKTVPDYARDNPELKIALLNLDVDLYEPTVTVLRYLEPKIVKGGVLILDDYGVFPGETKAVDEYFVDGPLNIRRFPISKTPSYMIKK